MKHYNIINKVKAGAVAMLVLLSGTLTSCQDFFDVDSTHIISANKEHLNNASDTIYSMVGILKKMQSIADRTILLGEARGDLMTVTEAASSDLRDLASLNIGDDNQYNSPAEYYAIINNCNYYIAHADTALKNNRNEVIFKSEYNAVKAIRAWTYLQLVTTYGQVPFVTEPVTTESMADVTKYPYYGIREVCNYFVNEDGLQDIVRSYSPANPTDNYSPEKDYYPSYGVIKSINSKIFYIPMRVILGDLYLWLASCTNDRQDYLNAAKYYYQYITMRNGRNSSEIFNYYTSITDVTWNNPESLTPSGSNWSGQFSDWNYGNQSEIISIIPTDSIQSEGNFSQLRNIFNTWPYSDTYQASLVPSKQIKDLSYAQTYIFGRTGDFAPASKNYGQELYNGDLRLSQAITTDPTAVHGDRTYSGQYIKKFFSVSQYNNTQRTLRVNIYRRTLLYLRLAEAMNRAGYPEYAFHVLATGINPTMVNDSITKTYSKEDSAFIADNFAFTKDYQLHKETKTSTTYGNTQGLHARGCGYVPAAGDYYKMPEGTLEEKIKKVEDMIVDEEALEFAFEGYRYYDLLRIAIRRNDNNYLQQKLGARNGEGGASGIMVNLTDRKNWFLKWNNQIGYKD